MRQESYGTYWPCCGPWRKIFQWLGSTHMLLNYVSCEISIVHCNCIRLLSYNGLKKEFARNIRSCKIIGAYKNPQHPGAVTFYGDSGLCGGLAMSFFSSLQMESTWNGWKDFSCRQPWRMFPDFFLTNSWNNCEPEIRAYLPSLSRTNIAAVPSWARKLLATWLQAASWTMLPFANDGEQVGKNYCNSNV